MELDKCCVIDIESNNLLSGMLDFTSLPYKLKSSAKLWCVVITSVATNESTKLVLDDITKDSLKKALDPFNVIIAHNGVKFDFIVLKLFGVLEYTIGYPGQSDTLFGRDVTFLDSIIVSRLLSPDRYGGHSLEVWGERVGVAKTDFRSVCIEKGYIDEKAPRGHEFTKYCPEMLDYCVQDTLTNIEVFKVLMAEFFTYPSWGSALKMETKLADIAVRRESLGFWFDKPAAIACVSDLTQKMNALTDSVNPILPPKPMNKGELKDFTPPKVQLTAKGVLSANMVKFAAKVGANVFNRDGVYIFQYEGKEFKVPFESPVKSHTPADISNLDHVKMYLISLDWIPTEWRERDMTKDTKKQNLSYEKRLQVLKRWCDETLAGKYKNERLEILGLDEHNVYNILAERLREDRPVRVPTSPCVRVGVEKELCPNLEALGEKVAFARDFALYLTYKHRKSSIAGGDIEDMDFDLEYPNTGFLSNYREEDGRVPTPAIEIGANTCRYRHISVANIPRATSVYGKEMRSLFGAGPGFVQAGFDFSSLEARINGHYVYRYDQGPELAEAMIAEKPNDIHSVNSRKLGIPRGTVKSFSYAILYGAQVAKLAKMLGISKEAATKLFNDYWDSVPALRSLKENVEKFWEANGKTYVPGIDGRKIVTRSKHSLLNALFQSAGVICAKYVTVRMMQILEESGYKIDVFKDVPDVCSMIEYHDECQLLANPDLFKYKVFETEQAAEEFIQSWEGDQLSSVSHGKVWYVTLPNPVSRAIKQAIDEIGIQMKLNVPLGFEWVVNKNWYGCH